MTQRQENRIWMGAAIALLVLLVFILDKCHHREQPEPEPLVIHDSIVVRDTIRLKGTVKFTTYHDTIIRHDTITDTVWIPIDHIRMRDTLENNDSTFLAVDIHYSGYKARIDSMAAVYDFRRTPRTITKENGWSQFVGIGIGLGAGPTIDQTGLVRISPYIGVNITYGWGYHWKKNK